MIDAINGIITWMNPSSPHEGLAIGSDRIVEHVGQLIGLKVTGMRGMRWKRPEDPKNIGLEANASYYIGDKAEQWYNTAIKQDEELLNEFEGNTPPDLVVEVEVTHLDGRKPNRYAELGAREMWQANFHQEKDQNQVLVTILDLQARGGPREVVQSRVLPNLTATSLAEAYWLSLIHI